MLSTIEEVAQRAPAALVSDLPEGCCTMLLKSQELGHATGSYEGLGPLWSVLGALLPCTPEYKFRAAAAPIIRHLFRPSTTGSNHSRKKMQANEGFKLGYAVKQGHRMQTSMLLAEMAANPNFQGLAPYLCVSVEGKCHLHCLHLLNRLGNLQIANQAHKGTAEQA